jgi:diamine N-acetyltransferase
MIRLQKIDSQNLWKVVNLSVKEQQQEFVATNTQSLLEAYVTTTSGKTALPFAIYNDEEVVGFVMFGYDTIGDEDEPAIASGNYCIWRFMIDQKYQGKGFGKEALAKSIEYLRTEPCGQGKYCWLSYEPENIEARALYTFMGFSENGEMDGEEIVSVLQL